MNRQQRVEKIYEVLERTIHSFFEPTEWSTIASAVSKELVVKNWLEVRGVLQFMIDAGMVERTQNVHVEAYVKTVPSAKEN